MKHGDMSRDGTYAADEASVGGRFCRGCRYDLRGQGRGEAEYRCPECGRGFDPENPRTFLPVPKSPWWIEMHRFLWRVYPVLLWLLPVTFIGYGFTAVACWEEGDWASATEFLALAAISGWGTLRARRLPDWPVYLAMKARPHAT